jgi:hypothetical protein
MATYSYKSASNFDRELILDITERNGGRNVETDYRGFASVAQAEEFAKWWIEVTGWGYCPRARVDIEDGQPVVKATRWDSCD